MNVNKLVVQRGDTVEGQEKRAVGFQVNKQVYDAFREACPSINLTKTFENLLKELTEAVNGKA